MSIEVLRLGTRVVTSNPAWPHIRKVGLGGHTLRYQFTGPATGRVATATVTPGDDPQAPCWVTLTADRGLDADEQATMLAYLAEDLAGSGHLGPVRLRTTPETLRQEVAP